MKKGSFLVEGNSRELDEKTIEILKILACQEKLNIGELAIEESGGLPVTAKVQARRVVVNNDKGLFLAEICFEVS